MSMEELKTTIESLGTAFGEFKKTNDLEIKALKEKGQVDPLVTEKLVKIDADLSKLDELKTQLEQLELKMNRPGSGSEGVSEEVAEHTKAHGRFLRKGITDGLRELEEKALNVTTDADGGFAVPEKLDRDILQLRDGQLLSTFHQLALIEVKLVIVGGLLNGCLLLFRQFFLFDLGISHLGAIF